jgi:UDP-N-acetylmuramyl tripeptide synthase
MRLAATVARAAGALSRRTGRGGTSLPGKVLLRLEPHAIRDLARALPRGNAVISATNGKTTTAAMVAAILERTGARLVHNRAGANMAGGVASALLAGRGDTGLFEVDEFWLDQIVDDLEPRAILLANLFRDQLDRYGELETIAERWAGVVARSDAPLVLNADDPAVAHLGRERDARVAPGGSPRDGALGVQPRSTGDAAVSDDPAVPGPRVHSIPDVLYFGVADDGVALPGLPHASDAKHCRRCGRPYVYDAVYLGHLGRYHCPTGHSTRPEPQVAAEDVVLEGVRAARFTLRTPEGRRPVRLPLPGLYNVYNALAAAALSLRLGAPLDDVVAGLEAVAPAFGRAETVQIEGRDLSILLVKNPAGANEVVRTLALEPGEHDILGVLNDRTADGRDVSWVWDADFEILAPRVRRFVCAGTRAPELAVRLKYAGVPGDRLVVEPDLPTALDAVVAAGTGPLYAIPTYTAMLELRAELVKRGVASSSWTT